MEHEDIRKGTENPVEVSSKPQSSEKDDSRKDRDPPEGYLYNKEQGDRKDTENPPEVYSDPHPSEKDDSKKDTDPLEGYLSNMEKGNSKKGTESPVGVYSNPQLSEIDDSKDTDPPEGYLYNMPQGDSKKGTENPPEVFSNPRSSEKDDSKKDTDPPEEFLCNMEQRDCKNVTENPPKEKDDSKKDTDPPESCLDNMEQGDSKKGPENPPEVFCTPQSSEKDDSKQVRDTPEGSSKQELNHKHTPESLKAKSKIVKKSKSGKIKTKKKKGSQQIQGKKRNSKNRKVVVNAECSQKENEKQVSDDSQQMETDDELPKENSEEDEMIQEKENQNRSTSDKSHIDEDHEDEKNKNIIALGKGGKKQKRKQKHRESNVGSRDRTNKDDRAGREKSQSKRKKREKLGGLIFMCNAKTKPDCFRYRVLGVSAGKKDVVLGVKPGLKLFLYDFDLKLLYGIYKASSSGGMKLEPRAFGGKFPAQVQFKISSDCFPLPESIFKKAIKENYNEKHKFKTELTVSQVRKLTELFRPVGTHSASQPKQSPRKALVREREWEAPEGVGGSWSHWQRERAAGDPYTNVSSYDMRPCERDPRIEWREEIPRDLFPRVERQGEIPRDLFLTKNYPAYEPYDRDYELLHHQDPAYRSNVPIHVRTDPLYLNEREHQNYFHSAISDHREDPYAYRHGVPPRDAYLPPLPREEMSSRSYLAGGRASLIRSDDLQRRETDYNRMLPYHGDRLEALRLPVSSRYSFAGPSFPRR